MTARECEEQCREIQQLQRLLVGFEPCYLPTPLIERVDNLLADLRRELSVAKERWGAAEDLEMLGKSWCVATQRRADYCDCIDHIDDAV